MATPQYVKYAGGNDIFDTTTGQVVTPDQASAAGLFTTTPGVLSDKVLQINTPRPDVKTSADFAQYAGKPLSVADITKTIPNPVVPPTQPTDYLGEATGALKSAQASYDTTQNDIQSILKELGGQTAYGQEALTAAGVPEKQKTLNDLNAQLTALNAQAVASNEASNNRLTTTGQIQGEQGQIERQRAIKALGLGAMIQAAQGNLTLAQQQAERAVALKYEPLKNKLEQLNQTLDYNYKNLTRAEQKQADLLKQQNDEKLRQLQIKETQDKNNEQLLVQALANGAPLSAVTQARAQMAAGNTDAAIASLATYIGTKSAQVGGTSGVSGEENPQLYSGLSSATASAVRAKVSQFKSEPVVQNFAVIQDGRNFAKSISDTTQNPADDQALIYSLAKALDPGSVVREGEYATAQKYAQSWVKAYGKGVEQALFGTGFLSTEARANIKKTIEQKYNSSLTSYNNLYKQYSSGINSLTGGNNGKDFIVDYAIPATVAPTTSPTAPNFLLTGGNFGAPTNSYEAYLKAIQ